MGTIFGFLAIVTFCSYIIARATRRIHEQVQFLGIVAEVLKDRSIALDAAMKKDKKYFEGISKKSCFQSRLAEKFAERAMSLASGANVATIAIQRSLYSGRRMPTKEVLERDALARKKVKEILGGSEWEYLKPFFTEEEQDALEKAMEHKVKFNDTGN